MWPQGGVQSGSGLCLSPTRSLSYRTWGCHCPRRQAPFSACGESSADGSRDRSPGLRAEMSRTCCSRRGKPPPAAATPPPPAKVSLTSFPFPQPPSPSSFSVFVWHLCLDRLYSTPGPLGAFCLKSLGLRGPRAPGGRGGLACTQVSLSVRSKSVMQLLGSAADA